MTLTCPICKNEDQGTFLGLEVRAIYDGVLVWQCLKCEHAWPRDFGMFYGRRNDLAREHAMVLNRARQAATRRDRIDEASSS